MYTIYSHRALVAIDADAINLSLNISRDLPDVSVEFLLHTEGPYPFGRYEYDFTAAYKFRGQDVWKIHLKKERAIRAHRYIDISLHYKDFPQTLFERRLFHREALINRINAKLDAEISEARRLKEEMAVRGKKALPA